ncbi:hypothetical protein G9A89_017880 [Geosiphon pyriformis]|nr:hypothetical protein G9A89_017880 [Geosiphon pyriformis]
MSVIEKAHLEVGQLVEYLPAGQPMSTARGVIKEIITEPEASTMSRTIISSTTIIASENEPMYLIENLDSKKPSNLRILREFSIVKDEGDQEEVEEEE